MSNPHPLKHQLFLSQLITLCLSTTLKKNQTLSQILAAEESLTKNYISLLKLKHGHLQQLKQQQINNIIAKASSHLSNPRQISTKKIRTPMSKNFQESTIQPFPLDAFFKSKDTTKKVQNRYEQKLQFSLSFTNLLQVKEMPIKKYKNSKEEWAFSMYIFWYKNGLLEIRDNLGEISTTYETEKWNKDLENDNVMILLGKSMEHGNNIVIFWDNGFFMFFKISKEVVKEEQVKYVGPRKIEKKITVSKTVSKINLLHQGKLDPYELPVDPSEQNLKAKKSKIDKKNNKVISVGKDHEMFLKKNYYGSDNKLSYRKIHMYRSQTDDYLLQGFDDNLMIYNLMTSRKLFNQPVVQKNLTRSESDGNYFFVENQVYFTEKNEFPIIYQLAIKEAKITCQRFYEEIVSIYHEKNQAHSIYFITEKGEVMFMEVRPNLCVLKYKVNLPKEILPVLETDKVTGEFKTTLDFTFFNNSFVIFSRNSQKVYEYKKLQETIRDYEPIVFSVEDQFDSNNHPDLKILQEQRHLDVESNYLFNEISDLGMEKSQRQSTNKNEKLEINLQKSDEMPSIITWLITKTKLLNNQTDVEVVTMQIRKGVNDEDDWDTNEDTLVKLFNNFRMPFYALTILFVVGFNFWWRKTKTLDESGEGNHSKHDDATERFSEEKQKTMEMSKKLESLIESTNKLVGEQSKIKDMMTQID